MRIGSHFPANQITFDLVWKDEFGAVRRLFIALGFPWELNASDVDHRTVGHNEPSIVDRLACLLTGRVSSFIDFVELRCRHIHGARLNCLEDQ